MGSGGRTGRGRRHDQWDHRCEAARGRGAIGWSEGLDCLPKLISELERVNSTLQSLNNDQTQTELTEQLQEQLQETADRIQGLENY